MSVTTQNLGELSDVPIKGTHEAQMTDCKHCWHGTGRMLMSNPPLSVDVCCECGAERGLRVRQPIEPGIHGPFAPDGTEKRLGSKP